MIKLFCCSSSLATATCFQTEQLLTQTMQSKIEIYITQTMLFRLSTQYKGSTQSFWIITRQNHHFLLAGMHWWPGGFTNNFCFEFDKGVCTVFERADTPNSEAWSVIMFPTLEECQECLNICSVPSRYLRNYFWRSLSCPDTKATTCHKRKFSRWPKSIVLSPQTNSLLPCSTGHPQKH